MNTEIESEGVNENHAEAGKKPYKKIAIWRLVKQSFKVVFGNPWVSLGVIVVLTILLLLVKIVNMGVDVGQIPNTPMAGNEVEEMAANLDSSMVGIFSLLAYIILFPLYICLMVGAKRVYLEAVRTGRASIKYLFAPFKRIISLTVGLLVLRGIQLIIGAIGVLAVIYSFQVHILLGIIVGLPVAGYMLYLLYLSAAAMFFDLIIYNQGKRALGGLKASYRSAREYIATIVLAYLVLGLIVMAIYFLIVGINVAILMYYGESYLQFIQGLSGFAWIMFFIVSAFIQSLLLSINAALAAGLYQEIIER